MGPRSVERGNLPRFRKWRLTEHGFNGATLGRAWKRAIIDGRDTIIDMLQWGHAR